MSLVFTPRLFGGPCNRRRRDSLGVNRATRKLHEACGGYTLSHSGNFKPLQAHNMALFKDVFSRKVVAACDVYLQAPEDMLLEFVAALASDKGVVSDWPDTPSVL
eukprot:12929408-Prorocentrum_lima.AAC.1